MRHLRRHADAFAQRGVWVDGFADVHSVCAHLDGKSDLANHVTRVRTDHAATQDFALVPVSMAAFCSSFRVVAKQQLGRAFVAAVGNGSA